MTNYVKPSAHHEYEKFTSNNELREIYESRQKWEMDKNSLIDDAYHKGEEKGIVKGIEKGEKIGLIKAKLEDAKLMKKNGIDANLISKITGLSRKEIDEL
jgi:predicted transposase/invertase (TIGR01784 family)